ncbi:cytochrome P450 [Mycena galopus ATCC 62051]|nr:cytochrome P450 [Mycena galopus ATCC 62051]
MSCPRMGFTAHFAWKAKSSVANSQAISAYGIMKLLAIPIGMHLLFSQLIVCKQLSLFHFRGRIRMAHHILVSFPKYITSTPIQLPVSMNNVNRICSVIIFTFAFISWAAHRRSSSRILSFIPKAASWLYGNMPQLLLNKEYGECKFNWQETYGSVYSIKGYFEESRLMISDPLTLKHVINNHDIFVFGPSLQKALKFLLGDGRVFLPQGQPGNTHRHLRNIMNPLFSSKNVRAYALLFIKEIASKSLEFPGRTVEISHTIGDAAQDVTGNGVIHILFDNHSEIFFKHASGLERAVHRLENSHDADVAGLQTDELARHLVEKKREDAGSTLDETLISRLTQFSLIPYLSSVKQNNALNVGIPDDEIPSCVSQGTLYKLEQMKDFQAELRSEIQLASANGADGLEQDKMPFLNALINEVPRLYSPFPLAERVVTEDCILPFSPPIITSNDDDISEISLRKGQRFYLAIAEYHRLTSIWGPDAREFQPSRWLEKEEPWKGSALGPHASLHVFQTHSSLGIEFLARLTFCGGPPVCVGILELKVFITEVIRKFVLTVPTNDSVRPVVALTLVPRSVKGLVLHVEAMIY